MNGSAARTCLAARDVVTETRHNTRSPYYDERATHLAIPQFSAVS